MKERILVTGGFGFIGSAYIRNLPPGVSVLNVDAGTYAADERRVQGAEATIESVELDLASEPLLPLLKDTKPDLVVHFAAATHVTRSESDEETFFTSNVEGTRRLLEAVQGYGDALVIHISTDEVYGPAGDHPFSESDKDPGEGKATSAYARSKALADDLARSMTDRIPVIVVRPSNCFGPWQHPEKAVARWSTRALTGRNLPVWGTGGQVRDWMFVDDAVEGLKTIVEKGNPGETYNLAPQSAPRTNLDIARAIAVAAGSSEEIVYTTAYDRPQHDDRYWVDSSKIKELGWTPSKDLDDGLATTVKWYRDHEDWWLPVVQESERIYDDAAPAVEADVTHRDGGTTT